jgi:hypothetical protein
MSLAIILAVLLLFGPFSALNAVAPQQPAPSQSNTQVSQPSLTTPQSSQPANGCPATPDSASAQPANCKPTPPKLRKRHHTHAVTPSDSNQTKTIVRNGSTPDPIVAISPGVSNQETSQKLDTTNQLLDRADTNLKQIAGRQLSPAQEDTVKQIKVYMQQAKTAAQAGEVDRAYTLANKADMLSVDLLATGK